MTPLMSWNRLPRLKPDAVVKLQLPSIPDRETAPRPLVPFGNGRSYGDVCLSERGSLVLTRGLDRFIRFDPQNGVIRCQSGITLGEILSLIVPYGWFLPVTPGTRLATLGGAVANDVHGKNHHLAGTIGHHIRKLELIRSSGDIILCSPKQNAEFFHATIGGLGLTGLISWVELKLTPVSSPWMYTQSQRFENLDEFWHLSAESEAKWPYSVAWVDCLATKKKFGRGILFLGEHMQGFEHDRFDEKQYSVPFDPPVSLINRCSIKVFNSLYYNQPLNTTKQKTHYIPYFYPLDKIRNWNRIYGSKGFYQYQCVVPPEAASAATEALMREISKSRQGSFLAVLKKFGMTHSIGMLSFARPGVTLALDFPNKGRDLLSLFERLDRIVCEAGGALYAAKDARMPAALFQSGYPLWEKFAELKDPEFTSHFWQRVTQ